MPIYMIYLKHNENTTQRKITMAQIETLANIIVYTGIIASLGVLAANIICWNILGK
jgi:hypothetical protein